jgi:hypothetical protein
MDVHMYARCNVSLVLSGYNAALAIEHAARSMCILSFVVCVICVIWARDDRDMGVWYVNIMRLNHNLPMRQAIRCVLLSVHVDTTYGSKPVWISLLAITYIYIYNITSPTIL